MAKRVIEGKLVVAVDFDGTITTEPDMGHELKLQDGCKEALLRLNEAGVILVLWTCRSGPALHEALGFLWDNEIMYVFSAVNEQLPEVIAKYEPHVGRKLGADYYLDDKNLLGSPIDWELIEHTLLKELAQVC